MLCKNQKCKKEHSGSFGSGFFCSRGCANSRERPKEVRERTANSLRRKYASGYRHSVTWRRKMREVWKSEEYRKKHRDAVKKFYKTHPELKPTLKELQQKTKRVGGQDLKAALLREGLKKDVCERCGQNPEWNEKKLVLQINHKDGDRMNNSLENLEIICPNCHTQTDNFSSKNKVRYKK